MTKIPWTDESWNPVTGCTKVAEGCKNCYAESMAKRFWGKRKFTDVKCHEDRLDIPFHWRKPRKVFVCSMGDLFHPKVPIGFQLGVYETITDDRCERHTFQILTKRPQRMLDFHQAEVVGALPNLWLGTSISTQADADKNIPILMQIPAAVRFVSLEPMLEPIDLTRYIEEEEEWRCDGCGEFYSHFQDATCNHCGYAERHSEYRNQLDQVIIGCESGPKRRPCVNQWIWEVVQQCDEARVPPFVKQMEINSKVSHKPEEWPEWARRQEFPKY